MSVTVYDFAARYAAEYEAIAARLIEVYGEDTHPIQLARNLSECTSDSFVESARYLLNHGLMSTKKRISLAVKAKYE